MAAEQEENFDLVEEEQQRAVEVEAVAAEQTHADAKKFLGYKTNQSCYNYWRHMFTIKTLSGTSLLPTFNNNMRQFAKDTKLTTTLGNRFSSMFQREMTVEGGNNIKVNCFQKCERRFFSCTMIICKWTRTK